MLLVREIATTRPSVRPFSPFSLHRLYFLPTAVLRELRALRKLLGTDYAGAFECNLSDNGCEFARFHEIEDSVVHRPPSPNVLLLAFFPNQKTVYTHLVSSQDPKLYLY